MTRAYKQGALTDVTLVTDAFIVSETLFFMNQPSAWCWIRWQAWGMQFFRYSRWLIPLNRKVLRYDHFTAYILVNFFGLPHCAEFEFFQRTS